MKTTIIILLMALCAVGARSQNAVNENLVDIVSYANDKGYTVNRDRTDDGVKYISYSTEDDYIFFHYLSDNNICFASVIIFPSRVNRSYLFQLLDNLGYYREYDYWVLNDYPKKLKARYSYKEGQYYLVISNY